jgi:methylmalonyl-CoA mutase
LTSDLAAKAMEHIKEIEEYGGMANAIDAGIPKMRIEQVAARTQAAIDSGRQTVLGVNKKVLNIEEEVPVLHVDNSKVRESQIQRLNQLKEMRDEKQVQLALQAMTQAAESGQGNLLELAVSAAEKMATVGEMTSALEKVFGRYQASSTAIEGVYLKAYGEDEKKVKNIEEKIQAFVEKEGRRPRILLAKMGQDGHDRGQKVIATAFADLGFDVDVGPLFQTPKETAKQAVENDVHLIGVSSLAAGHLTLVPDLQAELKKYKREDIGIVVGGVIPPDDYKKLTDMGVLYVFGPGTVIAEAAVDIIENLIGKK